MGQDRHTHMTDEAFNLVNEVARARDELRLIAKGEIQRGCRKSQYEIGPPGMRKMTFKEARAKAAIWAERLNDAERKFSETNK